MLTSFDTQTTRDDPMVYRRLPHSEIPPGQIRCLNDECYYGFFASTPGEHEIVCIDTAVTRRIGWWSGRRTVVVVSDWRCLNCGIRFQTVTKTRGTSLRDTPWQIPPPTNLVKEPTDDRKS